MNSLPTLPRRTWLERISLSLAGLLVGLGLLTAAGWWLAIDELLIPFRAPSPMKQNSAIAFAILGGALLALDLGRTKLVALAALAGVIGLLTLFQDVFGSNLHLDQLLVRDRWVVDTEHPGRMAQVVSFSLIAASVVLVWRMFVRGARPRQFTAAILGSIIGSAGLSTLLGYAADLRSVIMWGSETAVSPASALALVLLGLALVIHAWRESLETYGEAPSWSPMPAVIGCATATVILTIGFRAQEQAYTNTTTKGMVEALAIETKTILDTQANVLERTVRALETVPLPTDSNKRIRWDS